MLLGLMGTACCPSEAHVHRKQKSPTLALQGMAFGWELTMTFLLVAVVYAVAIGKPSFTETGPLAVGFTLWASAFVGRLSI